MLEVFEDEYESVQLSVFEHDVTLYSLFPGLRSSTLERQLTSGILYNCYAHCQSPTLLSSYCRLASWPYSPLSQFYWLTYTEQ